ncbi:hypothetical protein [Nonomuraea sp. NEAU-A123]|uniref:hypothetical protein n=1 Tax=Nonomuraea sp. NEAU-A123 TaxID=2839649 RepID=UPI001BE4DCA8|nr:hypothetical protein [Nonomuraea sp. NEAU-A123]MBT2226272.1 hypothetical protein [Nonomuraea sp. NEAU-A123]
MRFSTAVGIVAATAGLAALAALLYTLYQLITGIWAMLLTLLILMAMGAGGDVSTGQAGVQEGVPHASQVVDALHVAGRRADLFA